MNHECYHLLQLYQKHLIHFQRPLMVVHNDHKSSLDNNAVLEDQMPIPNLNIVNMDFLHQPQSFQKPFHLLHALFQVMTYNMRMYTYRQFHSLIQSNPDS